MCPADAESERLAILNQIAAITRMRRGTVNVQSFTRRRKNGALVTQGPYYLYSRTEKRRSYSQRLPAEAVAQYRTETENCRRFKELAQAYIRVCERLTEQGGTGKKNSRPRSPQRSTPRSRRSEARGPLRPWTSRRWRRRPGGAPSPGPPAPWRDGSTPTTRTIRAATCPVGVGTQLTTRGGEPRPC